jgi:hypothetical protein
VKSKLGHHSPRSLSMASRPRKTPAGVIRTPFSLKSAAILRCPCDCKPPQTLIVSFRKVRRLRWVLAAELMLELRYKVR